MAADHFEHALRDGGQTLDEDGQATLRQVRALADQTLAFAVAASANVPVILLTIFWSRFNTTGAIIGMLVGLISAVVLVIISPNVFTGPNPEPPATPIIDSGVDIVTRENVDEYVAQFKRLESGQN